jgi:hypothetical protein
MSTFDPGRSEQGGPEQPYQPAPGYAEQPGGYANAPQYSGGYGQPPAAAGPPPNEVVRATILMFVQAALGLLGLIFNFADADGIKDSIRDSDPTLSADQVDSAYTVGLIFAIIVGLIFAAAYVLLAIQVRKGKNWARIVTLVIAGLSILFGLLGLAASVPALSRILGILGLLINIAIFVLLLLPRAREFFASRRVVR